jgi:hypothetical protein
VADGETILEADGLRVVFFRQGDRYAHRVEVFDAARSEWFAVCESLEGAPDDDWPPSPPLQQLHVEDRPTGRVILLVGMAGRTHWSAAVEAAADRKSITFDVAARYHTPPKYLGSNYPWGDARAGAMLKWTSIGETSIEIDESFSEGQSIRPIGEFTAPPATASWKYEIRRFGERP